MALRRLGPWARASVAAAVLLGVATSGGASEQDPSFGHGLGKMVGGVIFEWPKTIVDATLTGPPVAGTVVGIIAGAARAAQTVVAGAVEMGAGFDPWGSKRRRRGR